MRTFPAVLAKQPKPCRNVAANARRPSPIRVAPIANPVDGDGVLRLVENHAVVAGAETEQPSYSPLSGLTLPTPVAA